MSFKVTKVVIMGMTSLLLDFFIFILWWGIAFTFNSYIKTLVGRQGDPPEI